MCQILSAAKSQGMSSVVQTEAVLTHKFLVGWAAWIKVKEATVMCDDVHMVYLPGHFRDI